MLKIVSWTPYQYKWLEALDSSKDEPTIIYEIEKYGYTGEVFAKHPPMIKLEWNSIVVYGKKIQLGNSFFGMRVVHLFAFGFCGIL